MEVNHCGLAEVFRCPVLVVGFLVDGQDIGQHQTRFVPVCTPTTTPHICKLETVSISSVTLLIKHGNTGKLSTYMYRTVFALYATPGLFQLELAPNGVEIE